MVKKTHKATIRTASIDEFKEFLDEFKNESDRAAVILGAAKLDILLYQLLQAFLLPVPASKDELLDGDSALGTFSSKIHMCHRIGLIDAEFARALHMIRKIRNSFAHETSTNSLDSGSHRDRVKELARCFQDSDTFHKFTKLTGSKHSHTSKHFRTVVAIMTIRLDGGLSRILPIDPETTITLALKDQIKARENAKKKAAAEISREKVSKKRAPKPKLVTKKTSK